MRGTKKTVEALEKFFETGKKPTQEQFFDLLASFYHKDEDIAFLINIAKATLTDVQAGAENSRFMTALRTYQAILWWARLSKLPLLFGDVSELIDSRINQMLANLMATDDTDNVIDTVGELFQAFQNFNEEIGGVNALRSRIGSMENILADVPNVYRQVQNTFDSLQNQVTTAQNTANDGVSRANAAQTSANNAQATANDGVSRANAAQATANDGVSRANAAQATADDGVSRANAAQATANDGVSRANAAQTTANDGVSRANAAQATANDAVSKANHLNDSLYAVTYDLTRQITTAQNTANDGVSRANAAQATANDGVSRANAAQETANAVNAKVGDLPSEANGRNLSTWVRELNGYTTGHVAETITTLSVWKALAESQIADLSSRVNALSLRVTQLGG